MTESVSTTLDDLQPGQGGHVLDVIAPLHAPEWGAWLESLGFIPGERVLVLNRAWPGGDPLAVRIGLSTFALRCAEAHCVRLKLSTGTPS